jgi:hypothetical protein
MNTLLMRLQVPLVVLALLVSVGNRLNAQSPAMNLPGLMFDSILVFSGDNVFSSQRNGVSYGKTQQLAFHYTSNEQVLRVECYKRENFKGDLRLLGSGDYDILDSLDLIADTFYRFRIRFKNLSETEFPSLTFTTFRTNGSSVNFQIPLFPYTTTEAAFYPGNDDLYLGESRKFELVTNNIENLVLDGIWRTSGTYSYRLVRAENTAFIFVEPQALGEHPIEVTLKTKRPQLDADGDPSFYLSPINHTFNVRNSRHVFLRMDVREIVRDPKNPEPIEVQIENNRRLQIGKTYRIEASEDVGGQLIAELFTQRRMTNDKVICDLRPYGDHRIQDGFLFIKDGDTPVFMTNIEITPLPSVSKLSVLRHSEDWSSNLAIKPGEVFDLRIEGNNLKKARFFFEELIVVSSDSVAQSDLSRNYRIEVPINVSKRSLNLYDGSSPTGFRFNVVEHQKPRKLDFVYIDYGEGAQEVDLINQPILYAQTVKDLVITFDRDKIDKGELLYGRQHLQIKARIEDKDGNLIETRNLGAFTVCPGEASPRHEFYPNSGCRLDDVYLNSYLSRKTHSLNEWSRIELTIEHLASSYSNEPGYSQRIVIYNQRRAAFDVEVSIPAGLITQKIGRGESLSPLFNGIGFAMVAQFSFYKPDEIYRLQPFKMGVGFLAQNAFNFNPEAERDLGLIFITSAYPVRRTGKFNFPLFGGFGYFMQDNAFFFMIGPGIQVSF